MIYNFFAFLDVVLFCKFKQVIARDVVKRIDSTLAHGHHQRSRFYATTQETVNILELGDVVSLIPTESAEVFAV